MPQARPLIFGAALLSLALPGHPLALLGGLPLDLPAIWLALLVVGWAVLLPGAPPRGRLLLGGLAAVGLLRVLVGLVAPSYGLDGTYRLDSATQPAGENWPRGAQVAGRLDFRGDEFPVHFINDVRYLNFYTPNQPKRDLLPFAARWTGLLVMPAAGEQTLSLEANGPATLELGSAATGGVQRVSIDQPGRLRDATLTATLPSGLIPITVTYQRPDEAMPWLVVRNGPPVTDGEPLGGVQLVRAGTGDTAVARDGWLRPLALALDGLFVGLLGVGFAAHLLATLRGRRSASTEPAGDGQPEAPGAWAPRGLERVLLALYVVVAVGFEIRDHQHLFGRAIILSGGNDWLAYEGFARDILTNGLLLTEGRALGQGVPFYYQPLYIYWVALTHLVLGESLFAPLLMNTALGIAAGVGVYCLTRSLFGRGAALAALPLFEVARQTVFAPTAGLLLSENLIFPLVPVFLLLFARLAVTGRVGLAVAAGFVLGLGGLARTTPLALLPPALLILLLAWRRVRLGRLAFGSDRLALGWRATVVRLAVVVVACTLTLGMATTRNYLVSGRPVPITSSAGANLWETHRPSSKVDLSRIDRDPLYERLQLDRTTREVVEFIRQDAAGYVGTLVPMFLFAVGVQGAVVGTWDVQPILFGLWVTYLLASLAMPCARTLPTLFLHAFIWSHLAQMTIFFSHQYGFRLILPMYVAMVPVVAAGVAAVVARVARLLTLLGVFLPARASLPPVTRVALALVAFAGGAAGLGAIDWRSPDAAREAFYAVSGDVAIAVRQAARPDLMRRVASAYFVGDDSRSTDVAYLNGLAFPTLRWFDGARGVVLPPPGEQALYVMPDRAAADVAKQCLGSSASIGRERDPVVGVGLELLLASAGTGDCTMPRLPIGAPFGEGQDATARLLGLDGPASTEPGRTLDVMIAWEALGRPRNRARPLVTLVDSRGRRWGQAETTAYPSSAWRPGERAVGVARLEIDPTLPPGEYRLDGGFSAGSGQARLTGDGVWGAAGLVSARGAPLRLVSRSAPLAADSLPLDRRLDAALDGGRLVGVDFDRETARAGERVRLGLFWEPLGGRAEGREVSIVVRRGGTTVQEWRGVPVDGTYPTTAWKPGEVVRDNWDITLPATLNAGPVDIAAGLAVPGQPPAQYVALGTMNVQAGDREVQPPEMRASIGVRFANGALLLGLDSKTRRARANDTADFTLVWRADAPLPRDHTVTVALLDEAGRIVAQQENEPAGGKRPTSGWTADEYIEDGWKVRIPRDVARGRVRLAVSLVDPLTNQRVPTDTGGVWVELPIEVGGE